MAEKKPYYGLFVPKKKTNVVQSTLSIFREDDSDEGGPASVGAELQKQGLKAKMKKQTQLEMMKALQEDPTVYEYDNVYDELERKRKQVKETKTEEVKKPKYIANLLKTAETRKREYERRIERKVHKEREAEGDQFADKEAYVTTAYRQKMEELQKLEDEEKRQDALEAIADVTKQKDLTGFYRHLMRERFGGDKPENSSTGEEEKEKKPVLTADAKSDGDKPASHPSGSDSDADSKSKEPDGRRERMRNRRSSSSSEDGSRGVKRSTDRKTHSKRSGSSDSSDERTSLRRQSKSSSAKHRSRRHGRRSSRSRSRSRSPGRGTRHSPEDKKPREKDVKTEEKERKEDSASASTPQDAAAAPEAKEDSAQPAIDVKALFARRNEASSTLSARERFLQRKQMQTNVAVVVTDAPT